MDTVEEERYNQHVQEQNPSAGFSSGLQDKEEDMSVLTDGKTSP